MKPYTMQRGTSGLPARHGISGAESRNAGARNREGVCSGSRRPIA